MALNGGSSPPRRRRFKTAALVALAVAAGAFAARNILFGTPVETYQAVRSDLVQTVVASGRIMTPQRVSVGAVITGRVARIPVQEGQNVRRGDVLIELDDKDERAAAAQARAAVAQAEAKVRQLREVGLPAAEQGLVQAQANATQARQQYDRSKDLKAKGLRQPVGARRRPAQPRRRRKPAPRGAAPGPDQQPRGQRLRDGADRARAGARQPGRGAGQARRDGHPRAGRRHAHRARRRARQCRAAGQGADGARALPAKPRSWCRSTKRTWRNSKLGQKALGSADAFPRERFAAELVYINPGIDALRGSVEVKLRVPKPPDYLRQDMTVSVDIEVARSAATVVVPADAVRDANSAQPWVLAVDGWRARRQPVKLGLKGDGRIEVLEGVAPGDRLISATNGMVRDGQRVRAIAAPKNGTP